MIFTDSHTHLYHPPSDNDRAEMVQRAINAGVTRLFMPNIDMESYPKMMELALEFPRNCFPMIGLHPCDVAEISYVKILQNFNTILKQNPDQFCAIGEIGIDLYWDKTTFDIQEKAFKIQCQWAFEYKKPLVIHTRESLDICINLIKKYKLNGILGVFHCFTGSVEQSKEIIKLGFMMGIGGVVTYKNTNLRETLSHIPLEHIMLETDAPYLTPVPHRGKRNESAYIAIIAQFVAEVYGKSVKEIAEITTRNSERLFGI